jgi:hypothetical protein
MGLVGYDAEGVLTIDSVVMNRPAWAVIGDENGEGSLTQLWVTTEQRGGDRIVPSAAGVIPYRRRVTATEHLLRLVVVGDVDDAGLPVADQRVGLAANLAAIKSTVVDPTNVGDGTRPATLTVFGQANRSANIHVLGLTQRIRVLKENGSIFVGTLRISIPAGEFT